MHTINRASTLFFTSINPSDIKSDSNRCIECCAFREKKLQFSNTAKEPATDDTGYLHIVVSKPEQLLIGQYHNYNGITEDVKARQLKKLRNRPFLRDVIAFIIT